MVTICGIVLRVEPGPRTSRGAQKYLAVRVPGADPLLPIRVTVNEQTKRSVPARAGDPIIVHGRYFNDGARDGIDATHHATSQDWPHPGYIVLNGQRYE